jgi:Fe-S cluster biogenesis protein NfuA
VAVADARAGTVDAGLVGACASCLAASAAALAAARLWARRSG